MTRHFRMQTAFWKKFEKFALPLFLTTFAASLSLAQPPGGPPPQDGPGGPPPGGPPFGRPGMPGRPPFGGRGQASAVDVPISMLRAGLDLNADQTAKIASIQEQFQRQRQTQFRRPGGAGGPQGRAGRQDAEQGGPGDPNGPDGGPDGRGRGPGGPGPRPEGPGGPGGPPDGQGGPPGQDRPGGPGGPPPAGRGGPAMNGMRNPNKQASDRIEAVLTASQKKALPGLLKELDTLRGAGIPAETYGDLKLTTDQKTRLAGITRKAQQQVRQDMDKARQGGDFETMRDTMQQSRQKTHEQAMRILTDEQRKVLEQFRKDHPRPQGRDGFGPPPLDGQPSPPPRPEGQDDGPPPMPPGGEPNGPDMPPRDTLR